MTKGSAFSQPKPMEFSLPCITRPSLLVPHGFFGRPAFPTGDMIPFQILFQEEEHLVPQIGRHVAQHLQKTFHLSETFSMVRMKQVHSSSCTLLETPHQVLEEGDAIVTQCHGVFLQILTADCGPILIHDTEKSIIAAVHAGWKGTLAGVIENTIEVMESLGSHKKNRRAVLGPTIHSTHYEVDTTFLEKFLMASSHNGTFFTPRETTGRFSFDLPQYILHRITPCVEEFHDIRCNVFGTQFFSKRYIDNEENVNPPEHFLECGYRNISVIGLPSPL